MKTYLARYNARTEKHRKFSEYFLVEAETALEAVTLAKQEDRRLIDIREFNDNDPLYKERKSIPRLN